MKYIEFTGKTVEEAIEKGLAELNIAREDADIRVLEEGKKKLFGFVKARVEIGVPAEKEVLCGQHPSDAPHALLLRLPARQHVVHDPLDPRLHGVPRLIA